MTVSEQEFCTQHALMQVYSSNVFFIIHLQRIESVLKIRREKRNNLRTTFHIFA